MLASVMSRMALWGALLLLCLVGLSSVHAQQPLANRPATDGSGSHLMGDARHRVLFIATSNVPKGKFRNLEEIAAQAGMSRSPGQQEVRNARADRPRGGAHAGRKCSADRLRYV